MRWWWCAWFVGSACGEPQRFPSPGQAGRGVPQVWVWYADPKGRFEVALPGMPNVGHEPGLLRLVAPSGPGRFSLVVTDVPETDPAAVDRLADQVLAGLQAFPGPAEPWPTLREGRRLRWNPGELRAGRVRGAVATLVADAPGPAAELFFDSFTDHPVGETTVALPGGGVVRCPARCGPARLDVALPTGVISAEGALGMVGGDRYWAYSLSVPPGETPELAAAALERALAGEAGPADGPAWPGVRWWDRGRERLAVRTVTRADRVVGVAVVGSAPFGERFLASLRW